MRAEEKLLVAGSRDVEGRERCQTGKGRGEGCGCFCVELVVAAPGSTRNQAQRKWSGGETEVGEHELRGAE